MSVAGIERQADPSFVSMLAYQHLTRNILP